MQVDSSLDGDSFKSEIIAKDKECETLGMSFRRWLGLHSTVRKLSGEFPWEGGEDSPHSALKKLIDKLDCSEVEQLKD